VFRYIFPLYSENGKIHKYAVWPRYIDVRVKTCDRAVNVVVKGINKIVMSV